MVPREPSLFARDCHYNRKYLVPTTIAPAIARAKHISSRRRTYIARRVAAEHGDTRTVLVPAEADHVLADVSGNNLSLTRSTVLENILDQVIAKLVGRDCRER